MELHPFLPIVDDGSRVLILGSFPSVRSREDGFYYAHPANRFWRVIAAITDSAVPQSVEEKRRLILDNGFALWDVIASCKVVGSSDSTITNVVVNEISEFAARHDIRAIVFNGRAAEAFYKKYAKPKLSLPLICLPSTSSANAASSLDALIERWAVLLTFVA